MSIYAAVRGGQGAPAEELVQNPEELMLFAKVRKFSSSVTG
jgi:hypothetical protein